MKRKVHVTIPGKKYIIDYDNYSVCDDCANKLGYFLDNDNSTMRYLHCSNKESNCIQYMESHIEKRKEIIDAMECRERKELRAKKLTDSIDNTFKQNEEIINLLRGLSLAIAGNIDTTNERLSKIENTLNLDIE